MVIAGKTAPPAAESWMKVLRFISRGVLHVFNFENSAPQWSGKGKK
jgi:hypothetical protein